MSAHNAIRTPKLFLILCMALLNVGAGRVQHAVTDRDAYNQGTVKLHEGDLAAAEGMLYSAVSANKDNIQPLALYNLGLTRFAIGAETLKEAPDANAASGRAQRASTRADGALQEGLSVLQSSEQSALVRAYLRGRGARREVKAALKALQEAMQVHGDVLSRWQRASGDFHSTVELKQSDTDAAHNAEVVDRHIAELVDKLRLMQMLAKALGEQAEGLDQLLSEMKGKLPDGMEDPGPGDNGDEDFPGGPEPGMEEPRGREGDEIPISPEDAQRLLNAFQLDRGRNLPMGGDQQAKSTDRKGKDW